MADSAISFLFNQLSIWLREELNSLGQLKQEAEFIHGEIGQMRAFLRVAEAKEETDPQLKEWVRQVREIANDTEDVLDRYMLQFAHRRDVHGLRGFLKKMYISVKSFKATQKLASEMKTIRSRVESACKSHQTYKDKYSIMLSASSSSLLRNTSYDGRGDALRLEEIDVVGIEEPKEQLLAWLSSIDCGQKVISVVGMAGLGKTTLVKKVYDDALERMNFDHHAWVTVSESFKVENILEDIIKRLVAKVNQPPQAPVHELEAMNDDDKREFIYNFLQNKNYIIVLDDIWRINAWEAVKYAFPRSNTNGRGCIIITTRINSIGNATCCDSNGHLYILGPLHRADSTKLFYKKAFSGNSCPCYLEGISQSILKRCEGLPLAIVVIGGLLATKNNRIEEWELFNRSLGSELLEDNFKRMRKLISLSFYDLPYYLKACFLYLSIFQEDQMIEKATIIRLWMAEGFVEPKRGKAMEEIAEGYLSELVNRSLIQVVDISDDGRPRNFRIHDLIREYIISKAREQNIAATDSGGEIQWPDKIRRLALYNSSTICTQQSYNFKHLRSLQFLGPLDSDWLPMLNKVLRSGCRMLKVLNLRGASLDIIPNKVFKLYHLKHLSLRDTKVKVIPRSIRNLVKLETLDLKRSMVTELPEQILKLQRLANLLVYRYKGYNALHPFDSIQSFEAPFQMGLLLCLQKLCYIDANTEIVREIGKLTQLQRLGITKLRREDGKELCSSLSNLTNLRSLTILSMAADEIMDLDYSLSPSTFPLLRALELRGCLEKVPQWIASLNALRRITLRWSRLQEDQDPLEHLQSLPSLQILLMECAYEGQRLSFKAGCFQGLKELFIKRMRRLRWVIVEKGSMPLLQHFEFWDCKLMVELPVGIDHLTHLHCVECMGMPVEFMESVLKATKRKQEEEQWKNSYLSLFEVPKRT